MPITREYTASNRGWGKTPSPRAVEVYSWIFEQTMKNGYQPSIRQTMDHFDISSTNGLLGHIETLRKYGYIGEAHRKKAVRTARVGQHARAMIFLKTPDGEPFRGFIHKPE